MLGKHYRKQLDAIAQSNGTLHYGLLWYIIGKRAGKPITFTKNYTMWNQCCFASLCCHLAGREVTVFNKQALCASMWWVFRSPVDTNVTGQCDAKGKTKQNTLSHETWILRRKRNYVITRTNNTMWVSLHTKGSGDPSSGCICNTAGPQVSVIESYSAWLNAVGCISCGLFLCSCTSRESYLSQTEQWWHRSGFSNWQRSQKRIAEETQAVQSHGHQQQQQQPLLTLDHRLTSWRGWNELWELHFSLDCSCCSHHINGNVHCTVPPELVRV